MNGTNERLGGRGVTTDLAVATTADLEVLSPEQREVAVTAYLATARDRLALALEATGPQAVAQLKAEIATAAEATKQLGLSREIQLDAQEMVRRAEYALGKAIRAGQEAGDIETKEQARGRAGRIARGTYQADNNDLMRPTDFASDDDLSGNGTGIYRLADGVSPEQFFRGNPGSVAEAEGAFESFDVHAAPSPLGPVNCDTTVTTGRSERQNVTSYPTGAVS